MHDLSLITTIAYAFLGAWVLGLITQRIGLSPIVGYLCAGIVIGPHTPGFVGNLPLAQQLAEIGVILLMFGVGLHFHLQDLNRVKWIAIPGAVGQSLTATALGLFAFTWLGLAPSAALVLGMAMSVASTVVLIRVLEDHNRLNTRSGHAAIGWLIVEDLFTVVALVLLPIFAAQHGADAAAASREPPLWLALGLVFAKMGALVALVVFVGFRVVPRVMVYVAHSKSRELFTLTVLVLSITIAAVSSSIFGASLALGAFLGGVVVGQSPVSQQAGADALPLRDAFAVLFFVSVGMLFDYHVVLREPLMMLVALGIVLIAKPLSALIITAVVGYPFRTGLVTALGLAQIGEFSFILSELGRKVGLLPQSGHSVLVATAIVSISLNPMLFRLRDPLERAVRGVPWLYRLLNGRAERRYSRESRAAARRVAELHGAHTKTAVVVGYGHVGQVLCRLLRRSGVPTVVVDNNPGAVARVNEIADARCIPIQGDATDVDVLRQAGVDRATHLLITVALSADPVPVIVQARQLNPRLHISVRSRYLGDREALALAGADVAVFEEAEAAIAMGRLIIKEVAGSAEEFEREIAEIREGSSLA